MKRMVQEITKEHPILFSTPMVQAILAERKTQTRRTRALEFINDSDCEWSYEGVNELGHVMLNQTYGSRNAIKCPYGSIGDVLWVRETFCRATPPWDGDDPMPDWRYYYKADDDWQGMEWGRWDKDGPQDSPIWKPSIHMPRIACRIRLEITDIRVERLQDISAEDAIAEGILHDELGYKDYMADASGYGHPDIDYPHVQYAQLSFKSLWQKINGEESWNRNPWVWCILFKKL